LEELRAVVADNAVALERVNAGAVHALDLAAWGYTLHGAYNVVENYFLRISKFFENHLPADSWHHELLERMRLNLSPFRPALLEDPTLYESLDELRGFRHVFRHQYGLKLKRNKLALVQAAFDVVAKGFPVAHEQFLTRLRTLSEGLE
jgi:hypothetical protein